MKKQIQNTFPLIFILVLLLALMLSMVLENPLLEIKNFLVNKYYLTSIILYFIFFTFSIIFSAIKATPIIPFMAKIFGATEIFILTMLASIFGATISFFLARKFNRKFVIKIFPESRIIQLEKKIPRNPNFMQTLFFRFFLPIDVFSYYLGFNSKINFKKFILTSLVGFVPLNFILSFGPDALTHNNKFMFFALLFAILTIILSYIFFGYLHFKKVKIITNGGEFHFKDILSVATLILFLEKRGLEYKIIRIADKEKKIKYRTKKQTQEEENGKDVKIFCTPTFDEVWGEYGEKVSSSLEVAEKVKRKIEEYADLQHLIERFYPKNNENIDKEFIKAVDFAKEILENEIEQNTI